MVVLFLTIGKLEFLISRGSMDIIYSIIYFFGFNSHSSLTSKDTLLTLLLSKPRNPQCLLQYLGKSRDPVYIY